MGKNVIELEVQQQYFDAIAEGVKTIEGRLARAKYLALEAGDTIRFVNPSHEQSLTKKVAGLHRYPTFKDAFVYQDYTKAIPVAQSVDEAIAAYEAFYPPDAQEATGVVFIELQ